MAEVVTKASIWLVILCYGVLLATMRLRAASRLRLRVRRAAWVAGAISFVVHVLLAFGTFYRWSWSVAWRMTAEQAEQFSGVRAGWGLWLNFAFGLAWVILALRERRTRGCIPKDEDRPAHGWQSVAFRWLHRLLHAFLLFMVLMGGIAFAPTAARIFTTVVFVCAAIAALVCLRSGEGRRPQRPAGS